MAIRSKNNEDNLLLETKYIRKAAAFWTQNPGYGGFRDSVRYDVVIDGMHFPPKAIVAIARVLAGFRQMCPADFPGAKDGHWHRELMRCGFIIVPKGLVKTKEEELGDDANLADDLDLLRASDYPTVTERETLILARVGQGLYRESLLSRWDYKCALTGCNVLPVIRASHAMPWRWASDTQRLDASNGLPLVATLDALFDVGLITFSRDGGMLVSSQLPKDSTLLDGVPRKLRMPLTDEQDFFLAAHREAIFQYEMF